MALTRHTARLLALVLLMSLAAFTPAHADQPLALQSAEIINRGAGLLLTFNRDIDASDLRLERMDVLEVYSGGYQFEHDSCYADPGPTANQVTLYFKKLLTAGTTVTVRLNNGAVKSSDGAPIAACQLAVANTLAASDPITMTSSTIDAGGTTITLVFDTALDAATLDTTGGQFSGFCLSRTPGYEGAFIVVSSAQLTAANTVELTLKYPVPAGAEVTVLYNDYVHTALPSRVGDLYGLDGKHYPGIVYHGGIESHSFHISPANNASAVTAPLVNGQPIAGFAVQDGVLSLTPTDTEWTAIMTAAPDFVRASRELPAFDKALYFNRYIGCDGGVTLNLTTAQLNDITDVPLCGYAVNVTLTAALTQSPALAAVGSDRVALTFDYTHLQHAAPDLGSRLSLSHNGSALAVENGQTLATVTIPYVYAYRVQFPLAVCYSDSKQAPIVRTSGGETLHAAVNRLGEYGITSLTTTAFTDLDARVFLSEIEWLQPRGIVYGTGNGTFEPDRAVTRAELITMLMRAVQRPVDTSATQQFSDVAPGSYYAAAMLKARELGIVGGTGNNKVNPNAPVTRQDMATMVLRLMQAERYAYAGYNIDRRVSDYTDGGSIAPYASEAVKTLLQCGIWVGHDNQLTPNNTTTRAEAAATLARALRIGL